LIETKKGRNPLEIPSERDFSILDALKEGYSQAEVGRVYGLARQNHLTPKATLSHPNKNSC
jgi:hypothetical protein